jgi:hypothetical protein
MATGVALQAGTSPWRRGEAVVLVALGAALAIAAVWAIVSPGTFDLPGLGARALGAAALYALAHLLRILRLALLVHRPGLRTRRVALVHLFSAGLGLLLPFKLNELVRIREVGRLCGSWRTGLVAVWLERALDAAVLTVLLTVALIGNRDLVDEITSVLLVLGGFVALTVLLVTVLPDNLRGLMLHLVRRPGGERSVRLLTVLRGALATLGGGPALLRGRLPTLLLLSLAIWLMELLVVAVAVRGIDVTLAEVSAASLGVLSGVSFAVTALAPGSADGLMDALDGLGPVADVDLYRLALVLPLLLAGAAAGAWYLPGRLDGRRR